MNTYSRITPSLVAIIAVSILLKLYEGLPTSTENILKVKYGSSVYLPCTALWNNTGQNEFKVVRWMKDEGYMKLLGMVTLRTGRKIILNSVKHSIRGDYALLIRNIDISDEAFYYCSVYFTVSQTGTKTGRSHVQLLITGTESKTSSTSSSKSIPSAPTAQSLSNGMYYSQTAFTTFDHYLTALKRQKDRDSTTISNNEIPSNTDLRSFKTANGVLSSTANPERFISLKATNFDSLEVRERTKEETTPYIVGNLLYTGQDGHISTYNKLTSRYSVTPYQPSQGTLTVNVYKSEGTESKTSSTSSSDSILSAPTAQSLSNGMTYNKTAFTTLYRHLTELKRQKDRDSTKNTNDEIPSNTDLRSFKTANGVLSSTAKSGRFIIRERTEEVTKPYIIALTSPSISNHQGDSENNLVYKVISLIAISFLSLTLLVICSLLIYKHIKKEPADDIESGGSHASRKESAQNIELREFRASWKDFRQRNHEKTSVTETAIHHDKHIDLLFKSDHRETDSLFEDDTWECSRDNLVLVKDGLLGEGAFGQVWRATFTDGRRSCAKIDVAVKLLRDGAPKEESKDFKRELQIMKSLSNEHPNIVSLLGCCTNENEGPTLIICELMKGGSLLNYLRKNRADMVYSNLQAGHKDLTPLKLLRFSSQISKGMSFLAAKKCLHRDLAARNILLDEYQVCKISDFGLARESYIYQRMSGGKLPIRWMAVESLTDSVHTTMSDVWSYGVLLWEMVTLGASPYAAFTGKEVVDRVCRGYRLEKPRHCDDDLYVVMQECWKKNPSERPSFSHLSRIIGDMAQNKTKSYINLKDFEYHSYVNLQEEGESDGNI